MGVIEQIEATPSGSGLQPYYSISDLAERWRCSPGTVYNWIYGEMVLDFAAPGRKGKKLVPREVVHSIEAKHMRRFR